MSEKQKYWYYIYIEVCAACGSPTGEKYRERRYTSKPEICNDRFEYYKTGMYDTCCVDYP